MSISAANLLNKAGIRFADECVPELHITDLCSDSRRVKSGALFCAYPGALADGRDYLHQAQDKGAALVLAESKGFVADAQLSVPVIQVAGLRDKIGLLAHQFFERPSEQMQVFGVTGTNGKTTCCYLLAQAFEHIGLQAAVIGTLGCGRIGAIKAGKLTTPDAISVHRQLAELRDAEITQVCMEVSSHALDQGRVQGVKFFATLFTNLSHDHLDYHGDMRRYAAAKLRLFTQFHAELAVINADDDIAIELIDQANADYLVSYGQAGDLQAKHVTASAEGLTLQVTADELEFELQSPLVGLVNTPNLLLLVATLLGLSVDIDKIQSITQALSPAPGRMELFRQAGRAAVVVDYAHTPDALKQALVSLREHCEGELWCVFGCGGDRDQRKRAVMGAVANNYADRIIVTNDNPRSESPEAIADDIVAGISGDVPVILDRSEAIRTAIRQASQRDWVLIAGKGHESTQTIGDKVLPLSDREQVQKSLEVAA